MFENRLSSVPSWYIFTQVHMEENAFVYDKVAFNLAYVYILWLLTCHRQIPPEF